MISENNVVIRLVNDLLNLQVNSDPIYTHLSEELNKLPPLSSDNTQPCLDDTFIDSIKASLKAITDNNSSTSVADIASHGIQKILFHIQISLFVLSDEKNNKNSKELSIYALRDILKNEMLKACAELHHALDDSYSHYSSEFQKAFISNPLEFYSIYDQIVKIPPPKKINSPKASTQFEMPNFFKRHWLALTLSASTGLLIGVTLGILMGVLLIIPTGGLSLLATPWAILILGGAGAALFGLAGTIGCAVTDILTKPDGGGGESELDHAITTESSYGTMHDRGIALGQPEIAPERTPDSSLLSVQQNDQDHYNHSDDNRYGYGS